MRSMSSPKTVLQVGILFITVSFNEYNLVKYWRWKDSILRPPAFKIGTMAILAKNFGALIAV